MNHDPRFPPRGDDAHEWAAQERALAEERAGLAPGQGDPRLRGYRLVAHALAQPLDAQLPPDFARRVARRAEQVAAAAEPRLERVLLAVLVAAMAVVALGAALLYGARWLPSLDPAPAGAWLSSPWAWALAACLGLSRLARPGWRHHDRPA